MVIRFEVWLVFALLSGIVSYFIAKRRGRDAVLYFLLGIVFNIFFLGAVLFFQNLMNKKKGTTQ